MSEAQSIRDGLADIFAQDFPVLAVPPGPWSYRVATVRADGRCDLVAVAPSGPPPMLPNVDQWYAAGTASRPTVGSTVVVTFLDGNPATPAIMAFTPLRFAGGAPVESTLDATTIKIGPTKATLIELGGTGAAALALAAEVTDNFNTLLSAIAGAATTPGDGGASFKTAILTALSSFPTAIATTKVKGA